MGLHQLRVAHSANVKTDMPDKNEKQLESVESVRGKVELQCESKSSPRHRHDIIILSFLWG